MNSQPSLARLFGVLNLYKPAGVTSRDVVNIVQRLVAPNKAGHAGTLDPMATGVLLVCVGAATRLVSILQQAPKTYRAKFRLGQRSDTDDSTGTVQGVFGTEPIPQKHIEAVLRDFCGIVEQTPPAYSAIRIDGRRAYSLARQGQKVALPSRQVRIDSIEILEFLWPDITVRIRCGSGTYIRSIARDLGERLECGGLMTALERIRIGDFTEADAVDPDSLTDETVAAAILPAVSVVNHISQYRCSTAERENVAHGRAFDMEKRRFHRSLLRADCPSEEEDLGNNPPVALLSDCGRQLLALAEIRRQGRRIQPRTVFMCGNDR